ncbi:hypothetical protein EDC94DRAFT_591325 [Helicostylum pulchrum]|nr:hypothetical protein EDC94DRAFT_591325 [Helicostylum pulchrum]
MEDTARVILNKLKLVDPTTTTTTFCSAYQQSAEIRQLWISVGSSIHTILTITSTTFSINPLDASSQIISVLSASTLLSSIIHAIITTQKRLNKSDENIESIIKKEMQVILYHIQILKQDLNQSTIRESAQEAIIHHTDILVDSLVAFSLSPLNNAQFQLHPYKGNNYLFFFY